MFATRWVTVCDEGWPQAGQLLSVLIILYPDWFCPGQQIQNYALNFLTNRDSIKLTTTKINGNTSSINCLVDNSPNHPCTSKRKS